MYGSACIWPFLPYFSHIDSDLLVLARMYSIVINHVWFTLHLGNFDKLLSFLVGFDYFGLNFITFGQFDLFLAVLVILAHFQVAFDRV